MYTDTVDTERAFCLHSAHILWTGCSPRKDVLQSNILHILFFILMGVAVNTDPNNQMQTFKEVTLLGTAEEAATSAVFIS